MANPSYVPKGKLKKVAKCAFCAATPLIDVTKTGLYWASCRNCKWRSRLFASEEDADLWVRSDMVPRGDSTRVERFDDVGLGSTRFAIVGDGWRSRLFQTEEAAVFWQHHHWGKPMKNAVAPTKVSVSDREPEPDNPVADLADLQDDTFQAASAFHKEVEDRGKDRVFVPGSTIPDRITDVTTITGSAPA
jgi:hypothetical protein